MTDDLVKRLRHGTAGDKERHAAADRIEKLEEENGVLFVANVRLNSRADLDSDQYVDRIEKLEAALRKILAQCSWYNAAAYDDIEAIIRKALEGKDD